MGGSVGNGASLSLINQSLIKSYFLLWLLRTCGALDGTDVMSCSALTTRLWCTFLHPRRPGLSIYPSWRGVGVFCAHRQRHISTVCTPILVVIFDNGLGNGPGNGPGLLFLFQDGRPISWSLLTAWLHRILAFAGIPGNFSSQSFRIGAATVAARNSIPEHQIQALGCWSSTAYIWTPV